MIFAVIFILLWSSGALFGEAAMESSGPIVFLLLRLSLACLTVFCIYLVQRPVLPRSFNDFSKMAITGLLTQAFYLLFFFFALYKNVHPGLLSIILGLQPILTALLVKDGLSVLQITGLILGLIGLIITVGGSITGFSHDWMGMGYALLSLISITAGIILQKKFNSQYSLTSNLFIQYLCSSLCIGFIYLIHGPETIHWTLTYTISLLWITFCISIAANYLLYYLLKHGKATNVTSYLYCVPLVTVALDYFIFHHSLTLSAMLGMALIIVSMALINRSAVGYENSISHSRECGNPAKIEKNQI